MSNKYKHGDRVPTDVLADRLDELSDAVTKGPDAVNREFVMRIPAELDRDADLVLSQAAGRLRELSQPTTPDNFPGMYQDAEGKVPVTDSEQPVGRVDDPGSDEVLQSRSGNDPAMDRTCQWWWDDPWYSTECGNSFEFNDGGPSDNRAKFCMYCGGKIVEADHD